MSRRSARATMIVSSFAAVVLAAGCGSSGSTSADSSASKTTARPTFHDMLPDKIKTAGTLTWVGDIQSPLRMQDSANAPLTGVQPDFAASMEKLLGVKIEQPIVASFSDVIPSVQSGRYDMAWGGLADTPEREQTFDVITWTFSVPTFVFSPSKSYSTATDLCGKILAHVAASAPFDAAFAALNSQVCAPAGKTPATQIEQGSRADLQLAVASGRADAYFTTPADGGYAVKQAPDKFKLLILSKPPFQVSALGAEFSKGNDELRDAIFAAMKQLWADGTYQKIMEKWGLKAFEIPAPVLNPIASGGSGSSDSGSPSAATSSR